MINLIPLLRRNTYSYNGEAESFQVQRFPYVGGDEYFPLREISFCGVYVHRHLVHLFYPNNGFSLNSAFALLLHC